MSSRYQHNAGESVHRQQHADYQRDGRMYDEDNYDHYGDSRPGQIPHHDDYGRDHSRHPRGEDFDARTDEIYIRGRANSAERKTKPRYNDRDREGYTSPDRSYRSRSRGRYNQNRSYSREPQQRIPDYGGPPSREIMLDGIPPDLGEDDISNGLQSQYGIANLKDVRVIRDRETKRSRGFGFIRLASLEGAQAFLEQHHPYIYLGRQHQSRDAPQPARIRIAFSREREDRSKAAVVDNEWTCGNCSTLNFAGRRLCFKCQAPPLEPEPYIDAQEQRQQYLSSGDSDAAMQGPPSQFLLIRGLASSVTEELLHKGVTKLLKPGPSTQSGASAGINKRGKVASTTGDANLGAKEGSIRRVFVVRDRVTDESWRYGFAEFANVEEASAALLRFNSHDRFTISSKQVNISFIHAGVFVPLPNVHEDPLFSFAPFSNPTLRLRYWNEAAYAKELPISLPDQSPQPSVTRQEISAADAAALAAAKEGLIPLVEDADGRTKKRKAETKDKEAEKSKKTTPAHLQFWSNRHAELHGIKPQDSSAREDNSVSSGSAGPSAAGDGARVQQNSPTETSQSYADMARKCCLLCTRQFKSTTEVEKHERLSKLHKGNLRNEELKKKALARMARAGIVIDSPQPDTSAEYRDRAKERRQAFGSSKKISLPLKKQHSDQGLSAKAEDSTADNPSGSSGSKGAALLGKMGWTSGEGLGARGEGVTEAIAANLYVAGVGLGAEGGKLGDAIEEASKSSKNDYKDFLQKTKDKAKERYQAL